MIFKPESARERVASPRAGTALAPRYGLLAAAHRIMRRDSRPNVTLSVTNVNISVTKILLVDGQAIPARRYAEAAAQICKARH
jgi:hypothetical protein